MESKGPAERDSHSRSAVAPVRGARGDKSLDASDIAKYQPDEEMETEAQRVADVERMRSELLEFMDQSRRRTDSDGAPLLHFPENFESVAAAMDRNDLTSAEEKPWSRYLLESAAEKEDDKKEEPVAKTEARSPSMKRPGRGGSSDRSKKGSKESVAPKLAYSPASALAGLGKEQEDAAADDLRLQRGLAEIALLDRQLRMASKRESESRDRATLVMDGLPDLTESAPPSGRMSAASSKYGGGSTFLTRLKGDIARSGNNSPLGTGRSIESANTEAFSELSSRPEFDRPFEVRMGDAEERAEDGEYADDRVGPLPLSTRNFLHENKRALGDTSSMTPEQKHRVNALLGIATLDDPDEYFALDPYSAADARFLDELEKISTFGYDAAAKAQLESIDSKLAVLRPNTESTDFMVVSAVPVPEQDEAASGKTHPNYLLEQRVERTRDLYSKQLDSAIKSFKRPMGKDDLIGLVQCPNVGSTSTFLPGSSSSVRARRVHSAIAPDRSSFDAAPSAEVVGARENRNGQSSGLRCHSSIRELPELSSVDPYRVVSMDDVLSVIEELCAPSAVDFNATTDDIDQVKSEISTSSAHIAPKEELDRLLEKHRLEIMQLAMMRNRQLDSSKHSSIFLEKNSDISEGSAFVDASTGFLNIEPTSGSRVNPLSDIELAQLAAEQATSAAVIAADQSSAKSTKLKKTSRRAGRLLSEKEGTDGSMLRPNPADKASKPRIRVNLSEAEDRNELSAAVNKSRDDSKVLNTEGDELVQAHRAMYPKTRRQLAQEGPKSQRFMQQRADSSGFEGLPAMPSKYTKEIPRDDSESRPDKEIDDLAKRILNLEGLTGSVIDSFFDSDGANASPMGFESTSSPLKDLERGSENMRSISSGIDGLMDKMNLMLNRAVHLGREDEDGLDTGGFMDPHLYSERLEGEAAFLEDYEEPNGGLYNQAQPSTIVV